MRNLGLLVAAMTMGALGTFVSAQNNRPFSPRDLGSLQGSNRDAWQKPAQVVEALRIRGGSVIADIGTGAGYFVPYLSEAAGPSGRLFAVDIQQDMLGFVERKVGTLGLTNVTTILSQDNDTRLPPNSVDLALLVDVYHELRTPRALLSNIKSVLKPAGRLAIIDFFDDRDIPVGPPRRHRVPEQRIATEAEAIGFELVEEHSFLPYQYFLVFAPADAAKVERH